MTKSTSSLISGPSGGLVSWLAWGAIGPAAAVLPVNWAADKLATAAVSWFKRLRQADDLSRLVKAADNTVQLSRAEVKAVRKLLEDENTWRQLGGREVAQLSNRIADCLAPHDGRTVKDSREAAEIIARGLLEFAISDLDPDTFQKVVLARLQQMTDQASALDKALYDLHSDLYACVDDATDLLKRVIDSLPPGPAGRGEITIYLKHLIDWLDTDQWPKDARFGGPVLTPSVIECQLRVSSIDRAGRLELADELTMQCQRLVILGGPGSGKTWLARRTARRCAEDALKELVGGAALDDVELPLFTTCSRLSSAAGDIRHAVVSSSLDQLGDLGSSRLMTALHGFFTERNTSSLLVIDSLDETYGADDRLRQAGTLPWRIVLTSRPSSWDEQLAISAADDSSRVAVLQPLHYPHDVEAFIGHWFSFQQARGKDLAAQIARRRDLQEAATVPLLLAFFCIVGGGAPLPELRSDLYVKVINRLLTGRWRGRRDRHPDPRARLAALRAWAWSGAASHPVTSLGMWKDEISCQSAGLPEADSDALDHIAAPMSLPDVDSEETMRRFIHRSIREHLVAEYVAGLPVDQAAEAVLPHLWYDPDWEYAAPAALAMHPEHDQLLQTVICRAARSDLIPEDLSVIDGGCQFQILLAQIADESSEDCWAPEMAAIIGEALVQVAGLGWTRGNTHIGRWRTSIYRARQSLLGVLANAPHGLAAQELTDAMVEFAVTAQDKRQAREALLGLLADQADGRPNGDRIALWLAHGIARLDPTAEQKHQARQALLGLLAQAHDSWVSQQLADALARLDPTAEERRQAREALLSRLAREADQPDESNAGRLVAGMADVATTAAEIRLVRQALLSMLAEVTGRVTIELVAGVTRFATTAEDKREARDAMLVILAKADGWRAVWLVAGVADLDPTAEDKRQAREMMLGLLAGETFHSPVTAELIAGITRFTATAEDKRQVRDALLSMLASQTNADVVGELLTGVTRLAEEAHDKRQAHQVLLGVLAGHTDSMVTRELVVGVTALAAGPEDTREARQALLALLARAASGWAAAQLADDVARLDPTSEDKRQARAMLLSLLAREADPYNGRQLAIGVARLDPTAEDRRQARDALASFLVNKADSGRSSTVESVVAGLAVMMEDKNQLREVLLGLLAGTDSGRIAEQLARVVVTLNPTDEEKRQVRQTLLSLLAHEADAYTDRQLARVVVTLNPTDEEKRQVRQTLLSLLAHEADAYRAKELAGMVVGLDPTAEDQRQVREMLIRLLDGETADKRAGQLVGVVAGLDPTEEDLCRISEMLPALLTDDTGSWMVDGLVDEVTQPTTPGKANDYARQILLGPLTAHTDSRVAAMLIRGVARLGPTEEDKRRVRAALLSQSEHATNDRIASTLIGAAEFDLTAEEKRDARATLLNRLSCETRGLVATGMVRVMTRLDPTAEDKRQARVALVSLLPRETRERDASELVKALTSLDPSSHDLRTCRSWAVSPPNALLSVARHNSSLDAWLAILPSLTLPSGRRPAGDINWWG